MRQDSGTLFSALLSVAAACLLLLSVLYLAPVLIGVWMVLVWVWFAETYQKRKAEHSKPSRGSDPDGFQP